MKAKRYTTEFKVAVAKEALLPEYKDCEHLVAAKYELREGTVQRWMDVYSKYGRAGWCDRRTKIDYFQNACLPFESSH